MGDRTQFRDNIANGAEATAEVLLAEIATRLRAKSFNAYQLSTIAFVIDEVLHDAYMGAYVAKHSS